VAEKDDPKKPPRGSPTNRSVQQRVELSWEGPIPPPETMRAINELVPDGADRLIKQVELESEHRRMMEQKSQKYAFHDQVLARASALIFAFGCLWLIRYLAEIGAYVPASIVAGAMIVHGINAFLGRRGR
jgi:uncharacterized membrane protein